MFSCIGFYIGKSRTATKVAIVVASSYPCSVVAYLVSYVMLSAHYRSYFPDVFAVSLFFPFVTANGWVPGLISATFFVIDAGVRKLINKAGGPRE